MRGKFFFLSKSMCIKAMHIPVEWKGTRTFLFVRPVQLFSEINTIEAYGSLVLCREFLHSLDRGYEFHNYWNRYKTCILPFVWRAAKLNNRNATHQGNMTGSTSSKAVFKWTPFVNAIGLDRFFSEAFRFWFEICKFENLIMIPLIDHLHFSSLTEHHSTPNLTWYTLTDFR